MSRRRDPKELPPKIRRPVFVQFVRVVRCRYNPSFARFSAVPKAVAWDLWDRWAQKRLGVKLPDMDVSLRPPPKRKKNSA